MELLEERTLPRRIEHGANKTPKGRLVSSIRVAPARLLLALRSEIGWPGAEQCLIEEVLYIAVGDDLFIDLHPTRKVEPEPLRQPVAPIVRHLGQQREPNPGVFAALRIVGGRRYHCPRPRTGALLVMWWKAATDMPKRRGSLPTSLSARRWK